ncbi:hypothetical protein [Metapseudomonas furukawaii]|uniref:Uncharacterized protein n=1 Tax=Metapseudomonas furukawaii TaxID=1149133 RepID=A0AAD1FIX0_METFU|nr:hypothetical protein [Pseudomonas furukawaii]ELS26303.1 hypothetical protein ppKF707_5929 [Pseudomonas furukawaii]BAU77413.1 hypothetical protein KF707C_p240 [Pseudomonas furukawaii]
MTPHPRVPLQAALQEFLVAELGDGGGRWPGTVLEALQEALAGVLQELAGFGQGKAGVRQEGGASYMVGNASS